MPSKHVEILYNILKQIAGYFWHKGHDGAMNDEYAIEEEEYSDFERDWTEWLNENDK